MIILVHLLTLLINNDKMTYNKKKHRRKAYFFYAIKMMKNLFKLGLVAVLVMSLTACTQTAVAPTTPAETTAEEVTTVQETEEQIIDVNLEILKEQDDSMINTYSLLAVNDQAPFVDADGNKVNDVKLNTVGADALINWMLGEGAGLAKDFGYAEYGEYLFYLLDNAPKSTADILGATDETRQIRLSTTTSVNDSGLLGYLLPIFEEKYGYKVEVYSAGTGKSIANAKAGNADVILVHAKKQEEAFIEDGFARKVEGFDTERLSYMYNFFVLCGPKDDPANVKGAANVKDAFKEIAEGKYTFISRGDKSGTHTKELSLWPEDLGITDDPASFADYTDWYVSSNAGMGACLLQASERGAYVLSDKATFLTFKANGGKIN